MSTANPEIIALVSELSDADKAALKASLAPSRTPRGTLRTAHESVGTITAGMTVRIKDDAKSVSKKYRGLTFTVTSVGTKGHLFGDNPDNVDPVTGAQANKNKRLWPRADECEIVASNA